MTHQPQNILAVDTATRTLRLALAFGPDRLVKSEERDIPSHGQVLMRKLDDLCSAAGLEREQLQALVVGTGPGSFTGLRIALAAVKGIALGLNIPVVSVSLFEVAARRLADEPRAVTVLAPFKRDALVRSVVRAGVWDHSRVTTVANERDDLLALFRFGPVAAIGLDDFTMGLSPDLAGGIRLLAYDAVDLLAAGKDKLAAGRAADLDTLEPLYAQPSQAELNLEKNRRTD